MARHVCTCRHTFPASLLGGKLAIFQVADVVWHRRHLAGPHISNGVIDAATDLRRVLQQVRIWVTPFNVDVVDRSSAYQTEPTLSDARQASMFNKMQDARLGGRRPRQMQRMPGVPP